MICKLCNVEKTEFKGKVCIDCIRQKAKEYSRNYRKQNPDKVRITNNLYNNKNREKAREWNRTHFENNKERVRERARQNYQIYKQDPSKKILHNTRTRITKFLKNKSKNIITTELLGCTSKFLKKWLEFQFNSEMSWDNYGIYWHIDHVIPCNSFDVTDFDELQKCFNWKNLRPLECSKNISKSDKIITKDIINQEIIVNYYSSKVLTTTLY